MQIGLMFANTGVCTGPEGAVAVAQHAEAGGLDSLWTVEHVVIPAGYASRYPYSPTGRMSGGEDVSIPDPLIWLAYVAARTSRLLLCTGVLILPQRSPLITAKEVATLDQLSGGRVRLGVGIGWLREEFEAIGVPFEERAARTEEAIAALRTLWSQEVPTFAGRFYRFQDARMWPKPVRGTVPVVIGGHSEAAARRAGRLGDGYFPASADPASIPGLIEVMRDAAARAGRDPATLEVTVGGPPRPEALERMAALGVDRVVVALRAADLDGAHATIEAAAEAGRAAGVLTAR
jgi:probable F420-dependent oxidoreductase